MDENFDSYKLCFHCHARIPLNATACHNCGNAVDRDDVVTASGTFSFVNCKSCGVPITKDRTHCPHCQKRRVFALVVTAALVLIITTVLILFV